MTQSESEKMTSHSPDGPSPFDARAAAWDQDPARRDLTNAIAEALAAGAPPRPEQTWFEYGCGTAALSLWLATRVSRVDAADASEGMLDQARKKLAAAGIRNLRLFRLDLTRDPPPPDRYDGIVTVMTLHHIADTAALFRSFFGLLKPGGALAVADLAAEDGSFHGDASVPHRGFDPEALAKDLAARGFANTRWRTVHRMRRHGRDYPVFLLCAERPRPLKVLFLCTGNSCRSQMAEGWARALKGGVIEPYSAGIETHGLNPLAVRVMAEAGVDIRGQSSKTVDAVKDVPFDYVVTVCGHANETCPMWLSGKARVVHVGFDDPPALAKTARTEAEALAHYRRVRDEIRAFVLGLPESLNRRP